MKAFSKKETTLRLLHTDVPAPMREAYNRIRVNLLAAAGCLKREDRPAPIVGLTTVAECRGRSYLAANLAISCAQLGLRTLLVDADCRSAQGLDALFGVAAGAGLADVAAQKGAAPVAVAGLPLSLLPRGKASGDPADLLGSAAFAAALQELRPAYDILFVSLPPVTAFADAPTASHALSGAVLGVVPGQDARCAVAAAKEMLQNVGLPLYGLISCDE